MNRWTASKELFSDLNLNMNFWHLFVVRNVYFNQWHAAWIALHLSHFCFVGSTEPFAPRHLPKPVRGGAEPGGERGQHRAAGPGREHGAPRGLPARADRVCQRDDQRHFSQQVGAGPWDSELERWGGKHHNTAVIATTRCFCVIVSGF